MVVLVASVAVSVWLWLALARSRGASAEHAVPAESAPSAARASPEPSGAPEPSAAREALPSVAKERKTPDADDSDPPTPERPGPGQALLRVEVVALETGAPLAGIQLWLWNEDDIELATSTQTDPARGLEGDDVRTDAAGRAEFVVVAGRSYGITGSDETGKANTRDFQPKLELLVKGQERALHFALPTAWTRDWYGRMVDGETGAPLVGAEVVALLSDSDKPLAGLVQLARALTDGDGRVSFRLPSWTGVTARCAVAGYFWGACSTEDEAGEPEAAQAVALHRVAALDVTVHEADGHPAPGFEVRMGLNSFELTHESRSEFLEWKAVTDAAGRCSFAELPSKISLRLHVQHGEGVLVHPSGWIESDGVELAPGEHRALELRLDAGIRLSGRVLDSAGIPLAGVKLILAQGSAYMAGTLLPGPMDARLLDPRVGRSGGASVTTVSDDDGRFSVEGTPPGVWALGPDTDEDQDLPSVLLFFRIEPGATEKEVELRLDRGLSIRGTVLDPEGKPVRGAFVDCFGPATGTRVHDYSARDGSFSFGPLVQGNYQLRVGGGGDDAPTVIGAEDVEAPAGAQDVVLHQRWGGVLHGRVVNAHGETVEASVELVGFPYSHIEEGSFAFANVPPGNYDLVATSVDEIGLLASIPVRPQTVIEDLEVHLEPGVHLTVRLSGVEDSVRIDVVGREIAIASLFEQEDFAGEQIVPPGDVRVVFSRRVDGHWEAVHEERRTAVLGEALTVEYQDTP